MWKNNFVLEPHVPFRPTFLTDENGRSRGCASDSVARWRGGRGGGDFPRRLCREWGKYTLYSYTPVHFGGVSQLYRAHESRWSAREMRRGRWTTRWKGLKSDRGVWTRRESYIIQRGRQLSPSGINESLRVFVPLRIVQLVSFSFHPLLGLPPLFNPLVCTVLHRRPGSIRASTPRVIIARMPFWS